MAGRGFLKKTLFAFPLESCTLFALPLEYFALPPRKNRSFKLSSDTCFRWNLHRSSIYQEHSINGTQRGSSPVLRIASPRRNHGRIRSSQRHRARHSRGMSCFKHAVPRVPSTLNSHSWKLPTNGRRSALCWSQRDPGSHRAQIRL